MTTKSQSHHNAETGNRVLWDEIAPVHLKAYKDVALLPEGGEALGEIEPRDVRGKTVYPLEDPHIPATILPGRTQNLRASCGQREPQEGAQ
jgi:hypothetical protein